MKNPISKSSIILLLMITFFNLIAHWRYTINSSDKDISVTSNNITKQSELEKCKENITLDNNYIRWLIEANRNLYALRFSNIPLGWSLYGKIRNNWDIKEKLTTVINLYTWISESINKNWIYNKDDLKLIRIERDNIFTLLANDLNDKIYEDSLNQLSNVVFITIHTNEFLLDKYSEFHRKYKSCIPINKSISQTPFWYSRSLKLKSESIQWTVWPEVLLASEYKENLPIKKTALDYFKKGKTKYKPLIELLKINPDWIVDPIDNIENSNFKPLKQSINPTNNSISSNKNTKKSFQDKKKPTSSLSNKNSTTTCKRESRRSWWGKFEAKKRQERVCVTN